MALSFQATLRVPHRKFTCVLAGVAVLLFLSAPEATQPATAEAWSLFRPAASFDRSTLTRPEFADRIRAGGTLSGAEGDWGITGQVEYHIDIPRPGWYELSVRGSAADTAFQFDPDDAGDAEFSFYGGTGSIGQEEKIGNVWLGAGRHRLRIARHYWTGFPRLQGFTLRASPPVPAKSSFATLGPGPSIFRARACPALDVRGGGLPAPSGLIVKIRDAQGKSRRTETAHFAAGNEPAHYKVALACNEEGVFTIHFLDGTNEVSWRDLRPLTYEVIDTAVPPVQAPLTRTLVADIDLATRPPDFWSGGPTQVVRSPAGTYRESGDTGFTRFQRAPAAARKLLADPSWFAYRLDGMVAQRPHLVEVDYPDDGPRSFAIALRESAPLSYPVAGGVDSGGEFSISNTMLTESLLFWPRAPEARLTILNTHNGQRAAAGRIRVYRLDGTLPPLIAHGEGGRQFLNWYEEGSNFLSMYGAPDDWQAAPRVATQRWAEAVRHAGGTVLAPTVLVYSFALYPSRYNRAFSRPDYDLLRRTLLVAEKSGLKVLPELHPRADELDSAFAAAPDPKPHLLVSKDGRTQYYAGDGKTRVYPALYNPLYPANQDWYVGMIGELADSYRDSPALLGVNLRLMQWANAALNNFHSLEWGYDDFTVALFKEETGSTVPMGSTADQSRFAARYQWLMANARAQWIDWRCHKIAALYTRIRDRVRAARADLMVYSSVFQWDKGGNNSEALHGAGIDPALLRGIGGVQLINATHAYGRKEAEALDTQPARDALLDQRNLASLSTIAGGFLTGANYIEITEAIAPPARLGFDARTKLTWTSATVNPAGRHHLERFAVELAETDATLLGDGGNAYSLGQPVLREFLSEYLRLPAEPFSPRADARDPVAVWERATPQALLFYAVNRERYPATLEVTLSAGATPKRLVNGATVPLTEGRLRIELQPYQLLAYRVPGPTRVLKIETRVPAAHRELVTGQVRWVENLARSQGEKRFSALNDSEQRVLVDTAAEASAALESGELWHARTALERRSMLSIYRKLDRMPPQLRDADIR